MDGTVPKKSRPRPPGGSRKGRPNKSTVAVKEALQAAFEGIGGVPKLEAWARKEPTDFYKLWAKMLPTEVKANVEGGITIEIVKYAADKTSE